jgi:hypothetical protein
MKKTKLLIVASLIIMLGMIGFGEPIVSQVMLIPVDIDIKPGSCPNPLNTKSKGVLSVAICGTDEFDVTTIDPSTITLECVSPLRWAIEDVATPFDGELCDCHELTGDGYLDLTLKFKTQELIAALGTISSGDEITLELLGNDESGHLFIEGYDCVKII